MPAGGALRAAPDAGPGPDGDDPGWAAAGEVTAQAARVVPAAPAVGDAADDVLVDATEFERLVAVARATGDAAGRAAVLERALGWWRGPALGDVAGVDAVRPAAVRLEGLRRAARRERAEALVRVGGTAAAGEAAVEAESLLTEEPMDEGAWLVQVEALRATGRAPEALRAYQRAVATLADAGLVPGEALRRAEADTLASGPPALAARPLPIPASSLVGREDDVAAVERLLAAHRVVTLIGPGGVGKTRLSLAVAGRRAADHEAGARLVALSRVAEPGAVAAAVSDTLGLTVENGRATETLARAGALDLLVVLDNCEHVLDEAAMVVEALVTGGTGVRVLATSRERLGVDGEHAWPVDPLPIDPPAPRSSPPPAVGGPDGTPPSPAAGASADPLAGPLAGEPAAVRLLALRVAAVRPERPVAGDEVACARRIVRRLDGLPLAIEMAAARAATMPLRELADRLDGLDGDATAADALRSPRRAAEGRHRTLRAVVEWSEALLDAEERRLLADLGVFAGPVPAADVVAVTGRPDAADGLGRLAGRSLVRADTTGDIARFGMLATIRDHARRRLAESGRLDELAGRHAAHVTAAAEAADALLRGPDEPLGQARFDVLADEVRSAHTWARDHDIGMAVRLSAALHLFAQTRLRGDLMDWSAALVERAGSRLSGRVGATVLASAAQRASNQGDLARGEALARRGVELGGGPDEPSGEACAAQVVLSDVLFFWGRLDEAEVESRLCLAAGERAGDLSVVAESACNLALTVSGLGRLGEAERVLADAVVLPGLGPTSRGWLAYTEGEAFSDRDVPRALAAFDRAIALADSVGNRYVGGVARVGACAQRARAGDPEEAVPAFASVIAYWRRQGALSFQVTTLRNLAVLLARIGAMPELAELLGALSAPDLPPTYGVEAERLASAHAAAESALGTAFAPSFAVGRTRNISEAADEALKWLAALSQR
jgi:predicted ATPase